MAKLTQKPNRPVIVDPENHLIDEFKGESGFSSAGFSGYSVRTKLRKTGKPSSDADAFLFLRSSDSEKHLAELKQTRINYRVILLRDDVKNQNAIAEKIARVNKSTQKKIFVFDQLQELNRVIHAYIDGVEFKTIASAWITEKDILNLKACDMRTWMVKFSELPQLANIPETERKDFEIDAFGNRLYWKKSDIHVDLGAVLYLKDEAYRETKDIEFINYLQNYGTAIAAVRGELKLTQEEIERKVGLTARQIGRIENGKQRATSNNLSLLAKAHGLELNDYLERVAQAAQKTKYVTEGKKKLRRKAPI